MNWIKQNYDRFLLALFAVILLVCSGVLFANARSYSTTFDSIRTDVRPGTSIPSVKQEAVESDEKELKDPQKWNARVIDGRRLPVFVSVPYIAKTTIGADGQPSVVLVDPLDGAADRQLHPPVPNAWLIDNKQDLLSPNVLEQDSDGDGFSTLDEWVGKTDPMDKGSHPAYYTKLKLTKIVKIPFRLRFDAKNGDTLQINTIDVEDAPTVFVKVGQMIRGTPYKVLKFEAKTAKVGNIVKDVSEVTVQNPVNGETIVLPKQTDVDSPKTYAALTYQWTGKQFGVTKNFEFTIPPVETVKYKCLDLNDNEVTILKEDDNMKLVLNISGKQTVTPQK